MCREIEPSPAVRAGGLPENMVSIDAVPNHSGTLSDLHSHHVAQELPQLSTPVKSNRFGRVRRTGRERERPGTGREKPGRHISASGNVAFEENENDDGQEKSRTWATAFKRHATALTAQFMQMRQPPSKPRLSTQAEFRRDFLKKSRDRLLKDSKGACFRMYPIMMNGDCGFASIAKGINMAREKMNLSAPITPQPIANPSPTLASTYNNNSDMHPEPSSAPAPASSPLQSETPTTSSATKARPQRRRRLRRFLWLRKTASPTTKRVLQAKDVRTAMFAEIRRAKKTYLADKKYESFYSEEDMDRLIGRLEREVSRQGIGGHWLGTVLDQLEYIIVAHAMNVNLYLYQFDLKSQTVVPFDNATVENAHCDVYLFFTGPPGSGHFDTLVKITDAPVARNAAAVHDNADVNDVTTVNDITAVNDITTENDMATVNVASTTNDLNLADDTNSIHDTVSVNDAATIMSI